MVAAQSTTCDEKAAAAPHMWQRMADESAQRCSCHDGVKIAGVPCVTQVVIADCGLLLGDEEGPLPEPEPE